MLRSLYPRMRATLAHFAVSLVTFLPAWWLAQRWYPGDLLSLQGGAAVLGWMALAHLIVAPLLTLVVFQPGKRTLLIDMVVIVVLQFAALGYGLSVLNTQKPAYLVFIHDRLFIVPEQDLLSSPPDELQTLPRWQDGPIPVLVRLNFEASMQVDQTIGSAREAPPAALQPSAYSNWLLARPRLQQLARLRNASEQIEVPIVGRSQIGIATIDLRNYELQSVHLP